MTPRPDQPQSEAPHSAPPVPLATAQQLAQPRALKTKDVTVPGRGNFRLRELKQKEREEIDESVAKRELVDGKYQVQWSNRGYKARVLGYTLVNADGSPLFPQVGEALTVIGELTPAEVDILFDAADELSILTPGARADLGKGLSKTTTDDGS